jgi:hypothetical protein
MRIALLCLAACVVLGGCVKELGEEKLGRSTLGYTVDDCIIPVPSGLENLHAPVSIEYPDRSLWIWESVTLGTGTQVRTAAATVTSIDDACNGSFAFITEGTGDPTSLLSLTPEEHTENQTRTDGKEIRLRPTGGFAFEGRGYLYYEKILAGPGFFEATVLGVGLCIIEPAGQTCIRVMPDIYPGEPSLLFDRREWPGNRGAFLADDGYVYLHGCLHAAAFEDLCTVAQVLPAQAADPAQYLYYNGFSGWIDDPWNATVSFETSGLVTPSFNPYLDRYVVTTPNIWESTIEVRVSSTPGGSFGDPFVLFDAVGPEDWFIGGGVEHSALGSADGRTIAVTYYTDATGPDNGLHLITFRFDRKP